MNAILSIKPVYARQILAGTKQVEFRKLAFKRPVRRVYIYSSAPDMQIVGYFTIREVVKDHPKRLWDRFQSVGGICEEDFFDYYGQNEFGVTFCIDSVVEFGVGIDPKSIIDGFVPPQSYRYFSGNV